jgi:hypothetical protein
MKGRWRGQARLEGAAVPIMPESGPALAIETCGFSDEVVVVSVEVELSSGAAPGCGAYCRGLYTPRV